MGETIYVVIISGLIGALQALILLYISALNKKLADICTTKSEEHKEIWKRLYGHKHSDNGEVIVSHESI